MPLRALCRLGDYRARQPPPSQVPPRPSLCSLHFINAFIPASSLVRAESSVSPAQTCRKATSQATPGVSPAWPQGHWSPKRQMAGGEGPQSGHGQGMGKGPPLQAGTPRGKGAEGGRAADSSSRWTGGGQSRCSRKVLPGARSQQYPLIHSLSQPLLRTCPGTRWGPRDSQHIPRETWEGKGPGVSQWCHQVSKELRESQGGPSVSQRARRHTLGCSYRGRKAEG